MQFGREVRMLNSCASGHTMESYSRIKYFICSFQLGCFTIAFIEQAVLYLSAYKHSNIKFNFLP